MVSSRADHLRRVGCQEHDERSDLRPWRSWNAECCRESQNLCRGPFGLLRVVLAARMTKTVIISGKAGA